MLSSDTSLRNALAAEIRDACINVGFFYSKCTLRTYPELPRSPSLRPVRTVKNHGVSQDIVENALAAGKRFFLLSQDAKDALDIHKSLNYKGYTPLLGENTDPANRGDLHEGFDIGWEDFTGVSRSDDGAMTGDNVWPLDLPGFRDAVLQY